MEGLPNVADFTSAHEFLDHFEIYMECFLLSKNITKEDKAVDIKFKFLRYALSKSPGFSALKIDATTSYALLKSRASCLFTETKMPFHDFWTLPVSEFSNAHDFVVKAKRCLSSFIAEERVVELLIRQRLQEMLPPDAALQLRTCAADFSDFMNKISLLWSMLLRREEEKVCVSKAESSRRQTSVTCYNCGRLNHVSRQCRFRKNRCTICSRFGHLNQFCSSKRGMVVVADGGAEGTEDKPKNE